jgi:putative oxidoreductase
MTSTLKNDTGLAILRIAAAAFMMTHGFPKFQKLIAGDFEFGDPIGIGAAPTLFLAVLAEFICPILIIVGFKTRWASVLPAITMLVAAGVVHLSDPFGKKEKALLYLAMFIAIILLGPGKYSVDKK